MSVELLTLLCIHRMVYRPERVGLVPITSPSLALQVKFKTRYKFTAVTCHEIMMTESASGQRWK